MEKFFICSFSLQESAKKLCDFQNKRSIISCEVRSWKRVVSPRAEELKFIIISDEEPNHIANNILCAFKKHLNGVGSLKTC